MKKMKWALLFAVLCASSLRAETVAVVGDMKPAVSERVGEEYGKRVKEELGLLKPELVVWAGEIEKSSSELVGETHVICLEVKNGAIGDPQIAWLRRELDRVFNAKKAKWVVVVLNRPVYLDKESDWDKAHGLLVEFNRRPIVTVEGRGGLSKGAKVWGVLAAGSKAYAYEPVREEIRYMTLGPAGARLEQDAAVALRHYTLLKVDGKGVGAALVPMGDVPGPKSGAESRRVLGEDVFTRAERDVLEAISQIDDKHLGVEGVVEQPALGKDVGVPHQNGAQRILLKNPLSVPITVSMRMASTENWTATEREQANKELEGLDLPWALHVPYLSRHLKAGANERWRMSLFAKGREGGDVAPPQVEFVVNWEDERGRIHQVVLKRRVAVVNRKTVEIGGKGEHGQLYAWEMGTGETTPLATVQFVATKDVLRISVRPGGELRGGESMEVAWVRGGQVQTRTVVGNKLETELTPTELGAVGEAVAMNVTLRGTEANGQTYRRSWAKGEPKIGDETAWGFVTVKAPTTTKPETKPATRPTTQPATTAGTTQGSTTTSSPATTAASQPK